MFEMAAWENGVGYDIKVDRTMAETIRDALNQALRDRYYKTGRGVGDIYEIAVEIVEQ